MRSAGLVLLVVCAAAHAQQSYDGQDGPYIFGKPGHQTYIRGQKEGQYQVDGVRGTFEHSASRGEHVYTDAQGNTYVHRKNPGGPSSHTVSGPSFTASRGPAGPARQRRDIYVSRPDRTVYLGNGGITASRQSRDVSASRPDRTVYLGNGGITASRQSRDVSASRPDRTVYLGNGGITASRQRRSPQLVVGPDGRYVSDQGNTRVISRPDGRTVVLNGNGFSATRQRRSISDARVQGPGFVARDDQAGVWNGKTSVWRRPDGRTVTTHEDGSYTVSSPGRAPQHYNG